MNKNNQLIPAGFIIMFGAIITSLVFNLLFWNHMMDWESLYQAVIQINESSRSNIVDGIQILTVRIGILGFCVWVGKKRNYFGLWVLLLILGSSIGFNLTLLTWGKKGMAIVLFALLQGFHGLLYLAGLGGMLFQYYFSYQNRKYIVAIACIFSYFVAIVLEIIYLLNDFRNMLINFLF